MSYSESTLVPGSWEFSPEGDLIPLDDDAREYAARCGARGLYLLYERDEAEPSITL